MPATRGDMKRKAEDAAVASLVSTPAARVVTRANPYPCLDIDTGKYSDFLKCYGCTRLSEKVRPPTKKSPDRLKCKAGLQQDQSPTNDKTLSFQWDQQKEDNRASQILKERAERNDMIARQWDTHTEGATPSPHTQEEDVMIEVVTPPIREVLYYPDEEGVTPAAAIK
jgi:hypothetical protein